MAMGERTRSKRKARATTLVPGGAQPIDFVIGRRKARYSRGAGIAIGLFVLVFVVAFALGYRSVSGSRGRWTARRRIGVPASCCFPRSACRRAGVPDVLRTFHRK